MPRRLSPYLRQALPVVGGTLLVAVIGGAIWLGAHYEKQIGWVQHTLEVRQRLAHLLSTLQAAETGQRGFLLTSDESYLDPYNNAMNEIQPDFDALQTLIADNPERQAELAALRPIVEKRIDHLKARIEEQRAGKHDEVVQNLKTNRARDLMSEVRSRIDHMDRDELRLLDERSSKANNLIRSLRLAVAAGVLLTILSLGTWMASSRRSARELAESNRALVAAMAEREAAETQVRQMQKMEAVGHLTGGIAHDFNNMLAVIISGLNLIQRRLAQGDFNVAKYIDAALEGADRAAALTKRLLAFARQQPLSPQPIDANKLVGGMSELLRRTLGETIQTETVLAGGLWLTHADASQLENALVNLCVNSRDAMEEGGKLTIETANCHLDERYARQHDIRSGQYVLLAVTDTGTGMSPDVMAKAIDPFFTTKPTGQGTGLGLSQVFGFVKQSGGHLKIYSEPGQGTTVKIYLPRFYREAVEMGRPSAPVDPGAGIPLGDARQTVLIVEDDDSVRQLAVAMLRELGYTVIDANGANTALRELDAHPEISLLFTDIVMPEINGRKLADEAKRRRPELKVLFTTGFTRNAVVHNGVLDPGVQFIAKPFTLEQIAIKVREILGAPPQPREKV